MSATRFITAYAPDIWTPFEIGVAWRERETADQVAELGRRRVGVWRVRPRCPVLAALSGPWGRKDVSGSRQLVASAEARVG